MTILNQIIEYKRIHLSKKQLSKIQRKESILADLHSKKFFIFGEIKPKSPSLGVLRKNIDLSVIIDDFTRIGCAGISVLTDHKYFGGSMQLLTNTKKYTQLPILRKDFIIDTTQIVETYNNGADIILFIVKILCREELKHFTQTSIDLLLIPLIEVHTIEELKIAIEVIRELNCEADVILAVNNRNLDTFVTDLQVSIDMKTHIPNTILCMSLSGILRQKDLKLIQLAGYNGVLIGQGLVDVVQFGK
jgi:indole-3-glycerol phosphate synthase